jgi:RimJ/RimL family protein N-acetyltransferase
MTAARPPQLVTLRSGDVVRIRPVRADDAQALARAYANLGEQSRYRRFFTVMPELPEATLKAAVEVDHVDHEALVAAPLLSTGIVGECRFIRRPDQPDTAEVGVTVVDAWQGRGLGFALLARLSEHALAAGIEYFVAEILAENRTMLALLPGLGQVETESRGPVVTARVELEHVAAARGDHGGPPERDGPAGSGAGSPQRRGPGGGARRHGVDGGQRAGQHPVPHPRPLRVVR